MTGLSDKMTQFAHSIRFRLVLWFTAILALILAAFSAFIYSSQYRDLNIDVLGQLERRIAGLESSDNEEDGTHNRFSLPLSPMQETDILILLSSDGQVIASQGSISQQQSGQLAQVGLRARLRGGSTGLTTWKGKVTPAGESYLFGFTPIGENAVQGNYAIYGSLIDPSGQLKRLVGTLMIGSLITLAIALGGGFWLADRAMRPVHAITQAARTISETDLSRRLNMQSKDELGELAGTFDDMLERLQAAFERQRQFIADASHELRTPLTIVHLEASRALAAPRAQQEYERALGVILSENDFMTRQVNDLLTLARLDAGRAVMKHEPLDLSELALEAVERLAPLAKRNHVRLETGELPEAHILGDHQYLLGMICNLIENGIKYTAGAERWVWINTGLEGNLARVWVSDNGPGIAAEHLPHLFDRFYRVDKARSQNTDDERPAQSKPTSGSGLGLAIAQWVVQAHGGDIRVESRVGEGTTFVVRFRAMKASAQIRE